MGIIVDRNAGIINLVLGVEIETIRNKEQQKVISCETEVGVSRTRIEGNEYWCNIQEWLNSDQECLSGSVI